MSTKEETCVRLPSYSSAVDFVERPDLNGVVGIIGSTVGRGLIITVGLVLTRQAPLGDAVRLGLVGASAVEVFVIGHALANKRRSG